MQRFRILAIACLVGLAWPGTLPAAEMPPLSETEKAELNAKFQATIEKTTKQIAESPEKTSLYSERGDARFFAGDFPGAVKDYEKMVELNEKLASSHWRRGIAYFYAKDYKKAANQFEIYHTFDDVDRENGIWRFFSQTKAFGLKKAREGLLKYEKDDREPFPDVYRLFAEEITPEEILKRIADAEVSTAERRKREFYAHLYIGLNHALHDRDAAAKKHLAEAVKNKWPREAGYGPNYMWHVGRVHYDLLAKKTAKD
jgi:lipoprotein NlpI